MDKLAKAGSLTNYGERGLRNFEQEISVNGVSPLGKWIRETTRMEFSRDHGIKHDRSSYDH